MTEHAEQAALGFRTMETAKYWKSRADEKDTSDIARLSIALIRFRANGCTCVDRPGGGYFDKI